MRPGRLVLLAGILVATGALYLPRLAVDEAAFRALTGAGVPRIWQELGDWGHLLVPFLAAGLVAICFRPAGKRLDRIGAAGGLCLCLAALALGVLARRSAAADAALVAAALGGRAAAGNGFWVLLAGTGAAAAGAAWDLAGACAEGTGPPREQAASIGEEDAAALQRGDAGERLHPPPVGGEA